MRVSRGASVTREKSRSRCTPDAFEYSWTTSVPERAPLFVTSTLTWTAGPASEARIAP
ncbi:hypothetical protein GCM10027258_32540 [Amycolatopsis stemonae]